VSSNPPATIGARIRERRHELGLSQVELSMRSGVHWTAISEYERGVTTPSLRTLVNLAAPLEVDVGDLVRGLEPW